ncbi:MAG: hypothetical protein ACTSYO_07405 [Candidatus Ranarchaeia archaeon]
MSAKNKTQGLRKWFILGVGLMVAWGVWFTVCFFSNFGSYVCQLRGTITLILLIPSGLLIMISERRSEIDKMTANTLGLLQIIILGSMLIIESFFTLLQPTWVIAPFVLLFLVIIIVWRIRQTN